MKLPNAERAVVPGRKITHYLLSTAHRDGRHKSVFFGSVGFKAENWELLDTALREHAQSHEVVESIPTFFGEKYIVEGQLTTPDGRNPKIRAVWFIAKGQKVATLVTAYPLDA